MMKFTGIIAILIGIVGAFPTYGFKPLPGTRLDMIPGKTPMYTKSDVDCLMSNINVNVTVKRYPMFVYRLNEVVPNMRVMKSNGNLIDIEYPNESDPYSYTEWVDFELKASTNNFISKTADKIQASMTLVDSSGKTVGIQDKSVLPISGLGMMTYYSMSNAKVKFEDCDPLESMRKYVHVSKVNGKKVDSRGLTFYSDVGDLGDIFVPEVTIILDPTKFTHVPDNTWCNDQNEEIVWSIARCNADGIFEKDSDGNVIWRNIEPIRWYSELPKWAYTNGENRVVNENWYNLYK